MIESFAAMGMGHWPALMLGLTALVVVWMAASMLVARGRSRRKHIMTAMREDDPAPLTGAAEPTAEPSTTYNAAALPDAEASLRLALERGEPENLPGLYLDLARHKLAAGDRDNARELLLQCVRLATVANQPEPHARARLELGELAYAAKDLTTACEHWQIARKLFHETGLMQEHTVVEARMLTNGCPTDWVLTDF